MGSTPNALNTDPAGAGSLNLRALEAVQSTVSGDWYLAVNGDPERFHTGWWSTRAAAEAHRDGLVARRGGK